ncbi:MAG: hypothetical protein Kow0042_24470 [Calditrichia bacterium]
MKIHRFTFTLVWLLFALIVNGITQSPTKPKLAILPFHAIGVEENSVESAELILRHELKKIGRFELISDELIWEQLGESFCSEVPCAIELGQKLQAEQVLLCKMMVLGEKIIVQFTRASVADQKILQLDQMTSLTVEDLDMVMKRLAMSIATNKPVDKVAEVGAITQQEELEPRRRAGRKFAGFSFGYLFPGNGYDNEDRVFAMDFRTGAEIQDFAVGMQLAIRKGFAVNIFSHYLFSRTDIAPYLGGGFGFHWVSHKQYWYDEYGSYHDEKEKRDDGFELSANAGLLGFRTYNIQIIINLSYTYVLNDYDDHGFIFTIGLLK